MKKYSIITLGLAAFALLCVGAIVAFIDPYLHYHNPLDGFAYIFTDNERYVVDGICKQYDYDTLIIGTSMIQNTKPLEVDEIFGCTSIKAPLAGAYYKEVDEQIQRAIFYNDELTTVIRGLDYYAIIMDKDEDNYDSYPSYLYDTNLLNDVNYLISFRGLSASRIVVSATRAGKTTTGLDVLGYWNDRATFGYDSVIASYNDNVSSDSPINSTLTDEDYETVYGNIMQNVVATAQANPDVDFYYFITPFSIYYFAYLEELGGLERQLQAECLAIELMLTCDNIHLFSFYTNTELITDADNYKDLGHYGAWVNTWMYECMAAGEYQLTLDNYEEYCDFIMDFYTSYDYDSLFE